MSDDTYNGWANRETWAAALHLDNDQGTYEMAREWAAEWEQNGYDKGERVAYLADRLQDFFADERDAVLFPARPGHWDQVPSATEWQRYTEWGRSMLADVGSLHRVEWEEIAEGIYEEG